jgi:hypothetical protein
VCGRIALAEQPGGDPIHSLLISPDVLIHHRAEIGLSDKQVQQIRTRLEKVGRQVQEVQERANDAMGRLAELLSADRVDEEAALNQLNEVLAMEKDQKRLQLRIMIQIRNELTPQQRQVAAKIGRTVTSNEGLEQRLKAKLSRIEHVVQTRAEAGRPPFDAVGLMQKFPELMQNGQVRKAEALLDRVITMLGLNNTEKGVNEQRPGQLPVLLAEKIQEIQRRAQQMQQNGDDVSEIQKLMKQLAPLIQQSKTKDAEKLIDQALKLTRQKAEKEAEGTNQNKEGKQAWHSPESGLLKRLSPEAVRAKFAALKKEDVAWRTIRWKTCLLDGLKASREQNKPIMLWIFIDRPIDDERC